MWYPQGVLSQLFFGSFFFLLLLLLLLLLLVMSVIVVLCSVHLFQWEIILFFDSVLCIFFPLLCLRCIVVCQYVFYFSLSFIYFFLLLLLSCVFVPFVTRLDDLLGYSLLFLFLSFLLACLSFFSLSLESSLCFFFFTRHKRFQKRKTVGCNC